MVEADSERMPVWPTYEIVGARSPPQVHLSRMLKHSLVPARFLNRFTCWQRRYTPLAGVLFFIAVFFSCSVLFMPPSLGCVFSVVSFVLQMPLLVLGGLALRSDVIKHLVGTFEFWFFTIANTSTNVIMAVYFGDLRALYLMPIWLGVQFNICIDAAVRGFGLMIVSLLIGVVYHSIALVKIAFETVPGVKSFRVITYGSNSQDTEDFLLNTIGTVLYMLARSVYRRTVMLLRARHRSGDSNVRLVRCVSYRCPVKLQPDQNNYAQPTKLSLKKTTSFRGQLQLVKTMQKFASQRTLVCGPNVPMKPFPRWQRILIQSVGALALNLMGGMFFVLNFSTCNTWLVKSAAIATLVLSALYCTLCFSLYNPGLLRHLCCSFDFCFMAAQFLFAHLCAAYIYDWDLRVYHLVSSLFWVTLVLTVDALTPDARQKVGFNINFLLPVLSGAMVSHLLTTNAVARHDPNWRLQDHELFSISVLGRTLQVHAMPAFLNRVWMLMLWEFRIFWRVFRAGSHDLVMVQGVVDLDLGPATSTSTQLSQVCPTSVTRGPTARDLEKREG